MTEPIFVQTHHHYDPYDDYFKLTELSGYPIVREDEIDPASDNTYIVSHFVVANRPDGWPGARARIILWQLEWDIAEAVLHTPGIAEVWTMDVEYARRIGAQYVPVGSHPGLRMNAFIPDIPVYDVAMLAYMPPRRLRIAHDLAQLGVRVAPNGWGLRRHRILVQSRAMLHVHQHDQVRGVACLRWAIAAAYKLPVITEELWGDPGIFEPGLHTLNRHYDGLVEYIKDLLNWSNLPDYGMALHHLLCEERTFRKIVDGAL